MARALKHLLVVVTVLLVVGCAGGGCGAGCAGCGLTPLPGGFEAQSRVENAASVRLTQSGMQFLQTNLGPLASKLLGMNGAGGVATFQVPQTSGSTTGIDYSICPNGPSSTQCTAEVDVGSAQLAITSATPHDITITGTLPVRLQDLPIHADVGCLNGFCLSQNDFDVTLTGNGSCPGDQETFANLPINVDISIEIDSNQAHSRYGYTRVNVKQLDVDKSALGDAINFCGGFTATLLNVLKPIAINLLYPQLQSTLQTQVDQALCQKSNPMVTPSCPTGTNDVQGICRYGTDANAECASIILGTDGHVDLGKLLATLSPGTNGGLDILLAGGGADQRDDGSGNAWGDLNPVGGGATLGMYGGSLPNPVTTCVKLANATLPTGIPIPDELVANTVPNWPTDVPGPHVGVALSERFTNYALSGMYDSGLLCLGVSGDSQPLLNSGTFQLLTPSLANLGLQQEHQQMALLVRPAAPPQVAFGNGTDDATDPLIRVTMKQLSIDFYIWSLDRFIRAMTLTFDIDVPVNLTVTPDGLTPVLSGDNVKVANASVTNSQLLKESPDDIAKKLQGLIGTAIGQALGSGIPPINLSSALASTGLNLIIPDSVMGQGSPGLRKLTKGTDNFLGIFASLAVAPPSMMQSHTSAELSDKSVDRAGLRLATLTGDNAPVVKLNVSSDLEGSQPVEYSYRIDRGVWHPFTRSRELVVRDEWLRLEARHVIEVRSRVVGQPYSLDRHPAAVAVRIDATPPTVAVGEVQDGKAALTIKDRISNEDEALVRYALDGGSWSDWKPASSLRTIDVGKAKRIRVEAKDEEGNVGTAQEALIRGKPSKDAAAAACGCSVPGDPSAPTRMWPFALVALGIALLRGRARRVRAADRCYRREMRRLAAAIAIVGTFGSFAGCSCGDDSTNESGMGTCNPPGCKPLQAGLIGAYSSAAVAGDGTIWVAGYLEGDYNDASFIFNYGDLVVGKWDDTAGHVDWSIIDGVPTDPPPDGTKYDVNGFRGGQSKPGDDVGLWTSIAIDALGAPAVAYYDRTHKALKFAQSVQGNWLVSTVDGGDAGTDVGRYAKLLFVDGNPVITYLTMQAATKPGYASSSIRVARASSGAPAETDWDKEDAISSDTTPCRAAFCPSGTVCVSTTTQCTTPATSCADQCGPGKACIDGGSGAACVAIFDDNKLDSYPDAVGDYIAVAPDPKGGFGIAFYDRTNGNMVVASNASGSWTQTIVDGQTGTTDTGDMGIGATLSIDSAGDWHVAYVDGWAETLRYAKIKGGTTVVTPELVDDGLGIAPDHFEDGHHIVGDDANIFVTSSGEVHITYQDATSGTLHHAVGAPSGDAHTWAVKLVDQPGQFAGAFSRVLNTAGTLRLMNWWRVGGEKTEGDVALVAP